tara:strand:- start:163 stop:339 length:177 start_codon:yes stop_codon:yes gene_type:complete
MKPDRALTTEKQNIINVVLIAFVNALALDYHTDPVIWHPLLMYAIPHTYQITGLKLIH